MSDIEKIKDILITAMWEAEVIRQLNTGDKKKDYAMSKFKSVFKDDYNNYSFILSGMIDLIIAVSNKEIKIGNITYSCFKWKCSLKGDMSLNQKWKISI